jgi:putative ABC transport system ATP-binding protein
LTGTNGGRPVIETRGLTRTFRMGDTVLNALDGVNLVIDSGEMVAIMGRSGSGKSTLMNLLGCLDTPTSGRYFLNGVEVGSLSDDELAEIRGRYIGFVFQSYNLLPRLTALANVEMALRYSRIGGNRRARAMDALARVELADRAGHRPPELSGGEQQRVAIARALVKDPQLILADEPTGNLDTRSSDAIIRSLQELNREDGRTMVVITHDPDVAAAAGRVVSLSDGRIVSDGRTASPSAGGQHG